MNAGHQISHQLIKQKKSFTQLLTTNIEHGIVFIKQTALYKKNGWAKILYQADISSKNFQTKIHRNISETKFKTRYSNHKKSFNHKKHKNDMQLLNVPWKSKASKQEPVLAWKILGQYQPYNVNTKQCLLYLNEKQFIEGTKCWTSKLKQSVNAGTGTNIPWQVTIAWIETSVAKLNFLEIIEIFEACGNLIYCSCEADWQKLHLF